MDHSPANKSHMSCPVWAGQVNWSSDPSQAAPQNPLSTPQQMGLGSPVDSRSVYDQLQASGLSCHSHLPCRGDTPSTSLFVSAPTNPSISNVFSLAQLSQTPLMQTSNHGKNASQTLYQTSPNLAPFQPLLTSQGLPSAAQDLPVNLPSCSQNQDLLSRSTGVDTTVGGYTNSPAVPAEERSQWRQPFSGNKNTSSNDQAAQRTDTVSPGVSNETRSSLIQQREELLKKLSDLDDLLKTMPPEDTPSEEASLAADSTPVSNDSPPKVLHDEPSDISGDAEIPLVESEDDNSPGFPPINDDCSDTDNSSSDEPSRKKCSTHSRIKAKPKLAATGKQTRTLKRKRALSQSKSSILVLQCVSKKGKRVYDKKNYCLFCSKPFSKLSRHLAMVHGDQAEVAVAFQHPKHSKERLKIWNRLKNKGNFAHNKDVMKTGNGFLAAVKRPKIPVQDYEFVHCLYCQGLYISKGLFRHMKKCPEKIKNEDEPKVGKRRLAFRCVLETLVPDISEGLKELLSPMINDPVTQSILNHKVILQFGEGMFKKHGADPTRHENIRQNLRQIARLVLEAQKRTPLKEMEDFFEPSNFQHVVSAVNVLAGYDAKRNTYSRPSLAIKVGYQLQKLCGIVENNAIHSGDESKAKSAQSFIEVYKEKWNKLVSAGALTTLRETKRDKEKNVPSVKDVKLLNSYMANAHTVAENKFREHVSAETYAALAKVILGRVILFNRRKPGEVSGLKLEEFLSRKMYDSHHYAGVSLSDLERTMCRFFSRIEIRGTCGRIVPVLLKQAFVLGLDLLVKNRETCGVPSENPFLFARPSALTAYSGSTILQSYVKECGAELPETLTTAKIRIHFAAMLQMLNLDENEANQILGPNYQFLQSSRTDVIDQGTFQDTGTQTSSQWGHNQFSCSYNQPEAYYPDQSHHVQTPDQSTAVHKPASTNKPQRASQKNGKQKWEEMEVRAVERHMMRFIEGHKVPQKLDCIRCLEAEPEALRTRAWKGVKDYVRNRITALKREESRSFSKNLPQAHWSSHDSSGGYYQQL